MFKKTKNLLERIHRNESGEMPIGPILVIAFIVVPLVILLTFFKDKLVEVWKKITGELLGNDPKPDNPF